MYVWPMRREGMGRTERGRRGERISTEDIIAGATLEPTYESEIHSFLC